MIIKYQKTVAALLGIRIEFFVITTMAFLPLVIPALADDEIFDPLIILETDKSEYTKGDSVIITGIVEEKKMPVIALRIFDPDGKILSANQLEIGDDNTFSKIISLQESFYEKAGTYTITVDYGKLSSKTSFELKNDTEQNQADISIINTDELEPEVVIVTDKEVYYDGETISISGMAFFSQESTVLVGIYDPFDNPAGFYLADVNSDSTFSVSFLVKAGVNFKTEGVYSVIARYGNSEDKITFEFIQSQSLEEEPQEKTQPIEQNNYAQKTKEDVAEPLENSQATEQNNDDITEASTQVITNKEKTDKKLNKQKTNSKIVQEIENKESKISNEVEKKQQNEFTKQVKSENKKTDNLSVEDIELGKLLNEITLNCETSEFSDIISYYDGMGPALVRLCKYHDAIFYYDKSLIDDPDNIEILNNKGSALSKLGLYTEAINYYNSALDIDPNYVPALNNKANALASLGVYDDAILLYDKVLLVAPDNKIALSNLEKTKDKILTNNVESIEQNENLSPKTENIEAKPSTTKTPNILEQISNTISSFRNVLLGFLS